MIVFNEANHTYKIDSVNCVSVTSLMSEYGIGNFSMIPHQILEPAIHLGNCVHKMAEYHLKGELSEETLDPALEPYLESIKQLQKDHKIEVLAIEEKVGAKELSIAGTLDLRCMFDGVHTIIDWKTPKRFSSNWLVQGNGYKYLKNLWLDENEQVKQFIPIRLSPSGYSLPPDNLSNGNELNVFMALLTLKNYKEKKS